MTSLSFLSEINLNTNAITMNGSLQSTITKNIDINVIVQPPSSPIERTLASKSILDELNLNNYLRSIFTKSGPIGGRI
jgi:hypothetical protein